MNITHCPVCETEFTENNFVGSSVLCHCGWNGVANHAEKKSQQKQSRAARTKISLSLLAVLGLVTVGRGILGEHFLNKVILSAKSTFGTATTDDYYTMGFVCKKASDTSCMISSFSEVIKRDQRRPLAYAQRGLALFENKRFAEANTDFESYFAISKGSFEPAYAYARSLENVNREDEAVVWYLKSIEQNPASTETSNALVALLVKRGQYTEALSVIGNMVTNSDSNAHLAKKTDSIVSMIADAPGRGPASISIPRINNQEFLPVKIGGTQQSYLVIDQSSSSTILSNEFLERNQISDFRTIGKTRVSGSDGQTINGEKILIKNLTIGQWTFANVEAVKCDSCFSAAGKSLLKKFKKVSKLQEKGVQFTQIQI